MAVLLGWVAVTTSATLSYGVIAAFGDGAVRVWHSSSAPATESIMGRRYFAAKAGVGSAVNDSTRLIRAARGAWP